MEQRLRKIIACSKCLRTGYGIKRLQKGGSRSPLFPTVKVRTFRHITAKKINVVNSNHPEIQQKALALFDIDSQLSDKTPKPCLTTKTKIGVEIGEKRIRLEAIAVDHLTNELRVVNFNRKNLPITIQQNQLNDLKGQWKQTGRSCRSKLFKYI
ncbi:unnamed protein product [Cercopithifilaria johnstoni]|uniref:Uncharacterized protein n=1 Tax=Cercopithifilaria johnstoni TaxID=2874296 RepID=A0A8J2M0J8_9BILA|nr:unnamed protein product [Cercopithifilaria johnstoni]